MKIARFLIVLARIILGGFAWTVEMANAGG